MRVTVCQLTNYGGILDDEWDRLVDHVRAEGSDLLVLPEMPFSRWLAADYTVVPEQWDEAADRSEEWVAVLPAFAPTAVVGTRAVVDDDGTRRNGGFVVDGGDARDVHDKSMLPDQPGWWEARWYQAATPAFEPFDVAGAKAGMLICSELWAMDRARGYGTAGVDLIVVPRATGHDSLEVWLAATRTAAVVSGAFVASSNLHRPPGGVDLGGMGMVVSPDGDLLAFTDAQDPFATVEVDLAVAAAAKSTYPRDLL